LPARASQPTTEPFGFERLPVTGIAATMTAFLAAPALGAFATLMLLIGLAALLALRWRGLPALIAAGLPLLALPLFAAASMLWSDVPDVSLRYGVQLVLTALAGIALGRALTLRQLVLAVFIGLSVACLAGLALGRTGTSENGPVLIGLSGSKNQMGYIALAWLAAGLCVAASGGYRPWARVAGGLAAVPAMFLIVQGESATALISAAVLVGLLGLLAVAAWLGRGGRLFALVAAALLVVPALVALPEIERQAMIIQTDVLGKDARLTGRTLLWEEADSLIAQAPLVGHGYKAIWLGPKGKGLLARNGQKDGRAFHFHDTFRELLADLGMVGLGLFLLPLVLAALRTVLLLIAAVDAPRAFAVATLFTIALRTRTELVVGPFLIDTVLLWALVTALAALPLSAPAADSPSRPAREPHRRTRRSFPKPQRNPA
jgi:exopolysaccharide production protein ExoQ